jgi:GNAT superfamily N-acetyltransferase
MSAPALRIVPANEASWDDLQTIFGERGEAHRCQCQWFKIPSAQWRGVSPAQRADLLFAQTHPGEPGAPETTGLVAYLGAEPAGWCAVEPRSVYLHLRTMRVPWSGRAEDRDDDGVWAVTCFVTRAGYRRRGVSRALAAAAVGFARERGARAVEGYPLILAPDQEMSWGELYVGSHGIFADAGFVEVSRPTRRRAVMRIEF